VNAASTWRLEFARNAANAFVTNDKVDAVIVGGSTARGHADRWSDIELGVFWSEPPTDADRESAAERVDGDLFRHYPFDATEQVWCDDFYLGHDADGGPNTGVLLEVIHMTVEAMDEALDTVLNSFDPDPSKQNVLSAIKDGVPLHGSTSMDEWKERVGTYPDGLAEAVVRANAQIDHFWRSEMWIDRGDNAMMLRDSFIVAERRMLHTLLGLNRQYFFGFKWLDVVDQRLEAKPPGLIERIRESHAVGGREGALIVSGLVEETYDLLDRSDIDIDVERLRSIFRYRRSTWGTTPPDP
jgi:predicted nucleotidyltransferase